MSHLVRSRKARRFQQKKHGLDSLPRMRRIDTIVQLCKRIPQIYENVKTVHLRSCGMAPAQTLNRTYTVLTKLLLNCFCI